MKNKIYQWLDESDGIGLSICVASVATVLCLLLLLFGVRHDLARWIAIFAS